MPIERTPSVVSSPCRTRFSQRLRLVDDIFRGRTHVALDLGQVPLNRCALGAGLGLANAGDLIRVRHTFLLPPVMCGKDQ
jgi:hypothetical protein